MATTTRADTGIAVPVLTGLALGALLDGVVLHQVVQWHHVWSGHITDDTLAGLRDNVFIDGVLQLAMIAILTAAVVALGRQPRRSWPSLIGGVLIGWGAFNVVDQLVFHLGLHAHHIREDVADPWVWDWGFALAGVVMAVIGVLVVRRGRRRDVVDGR
jgi:uncharacterized membrane protein